MKKIKAVFLTANITLLAACGAISNSGIVGNEQISDVPPEEQLSSSAFAYTMSADYRSAGGVGNNPGGSILFYNPDSKTWSDVATDGLEVASFAYDGQSLYYTDYSHDYVLDRQGLEAINHEDHHAPDVPLLFAIPQEQGGGMVALANQGVTDEGKGYLWEVIVTQGDERKVYPLNHYIGFAAQCEDGSVWGWSDPYLTSSESGYGSADGPQEILKLYPNFEPEPINSIKQEKRAISGNDLSCSNGVLYYIRDTFKPEITEPYGGGPGDHDGSLLVSYDTKTGEVQQRELSGDWAVRRTDKMWNSDLIYRHIYNGDLWWISGSGDVVRTDLETAHNTTVFKLEGYDPSQSVGLIDFQGKYLFQSIPYDGRDGDLYRYNLDTGELESHAKIPDITDVEKKYQFPTDFVITDLEKALEL